MNLFETVKVGKSPPLSVSSTSSSSSITKQQHKLDASPVSGRPAAATSATASHQRSEYYIENKENRTTMAKSNAFACQKQLDNCTNLSRLKNGNLSTNDPTPKPSAIVSKVLLPHESTTTTTSTKKKMTTMIVDMYGDQIAADNDVPGKVINSYPTTNGAAINGGPIYNSSSPSSSSSSSNSSSSNNNLDFNVQECMDQMLAADCPFDKLNYLQQMNNNPSSSFDAFKMSTNSVHKSMENIYENCVRMPNVTQRSDDNDRDVASASSSSNYSNYQQDSNENIITSKSNAVTSSASAVSTVVSNNNNKSNAHTISTTQNCTQKSNNNNISSSVSNYNQIFFVTNTTELHDIQEIDDDDDDEDNVANGGDDDTKNDDENAFVSRYCGNNWSSAKNPALAKHHKNYVPPSMAMSSSSFAAAAAAMNDFNTTNRNPFLQLMEMPTPSTSSAITGSSSTTNSSSNGASLFFNARSPCDGSVAPTSVTNNNGVALGINEPIKLFDSLASLAIVAASMTHENNGENDADIGACLGKLLATEMKIANGQAAASALNDTDASPIDAMKALRLLLKERDGNNYIKQFLQVISPANNV